MKHNQNINGHEAKYHCTIITSSEARHTVKGEANILISNVLINIEYTEVLHFISRYLHEPDIIAAIK